ncbi:MAG: NifB/NifX family molybdenum-iron cluster-binding protein [Candidatus Heimdallarchaeota archaeon]
MKLAFPTNDDKGLESYLSDHFGRAPIYTLIQNKTNEIKIIQNTGEHFGGGYSAPALLEEHGTNVLICRALGRKAVSRFKEAGIEIFITDKLIVKDALEAYNKRELKTASEEEACAGQHKH